MEKDQKTAGFSIHLNGACQLQKRGVDRLLRVTNGMLWLTESSSHTANIPADVWLSAGDTFVLKAGASGVIEGCPSAEYEILLAHEKGAAMAPWSGLLSSLASMRPNYLREAS